MARKSARKNRESKRPKLRAASPVQGAGDVIVVCWLLALATTLMCSLVAGGLYLFTWLRPPAAPDAGAAPLLGPAVVLGYLLVAAAAIGLVALALTPLVARYGRLRPTRRVLWIAALLAAAPLATLLARVLI